MGKSMKRRLLALAAATLLLAACSPMRIRLGAAREGGVYQQFCAAYAALPGKIPVEEKLTAGSAANLRLLSNGYIQMAVAQADLAADAYNGTGLFAYEDKMNGFGVVAALYPEACQLVVRADSDIVTPEDLQGRTVSIGEEESGTAQNAGQILAAYGLNDHLVHTVALDYTQAAEELRSGAIDALFCTAGTQTAVLEELAADCGIRLIEIDGAAADRLLATYPAYQRLTIPAGTYTGQTEDAATVGVQALLLASDTLSEPMVEALTRRLFTNTETLQAALSPALLSPEDACRNLPVPLHPGAEAWYRAQGLTPAATGEEAAA